MRKCAALLWCVAGLDRTAPQYFLETRGDFWAAAIAVSRSRPLDLFKRHPDKFMLCGGGNVTLKKFQEKGEVRDLLDMQGAAKASRRSQLPRTRTRAKEKGGTGRRKSMHWEMTPLGSRRTQNSLAICRIDANAMSCHVMSCLIS